MSHIHTNSPIQAVLKSMCGAMFIAAFFCLTFVPYPVNKSTSFLSFQGLRNLIYIAAGLLTYSATDCKLKEIP